MKLLQKIPFAEIRNIRIFYLFSVIQESFFTEGNWLLLFLKYFSYGELGILDALTFALGLLLEIPTGAVADLIGKKRTLQTSYLTMVIALAIMSFAESQLAIWVASVFMVTGLALYSGASEAFAYDALAEKGKAESFDKMYSYSKALRSITFILAAGIGALASRIDLRLPFILWGLVNLVGFIASFYITEPKLDTYKFNWNNYWKQNLAGFRELLTPKLKPYLIFILVLLGIDFMYGWGFLKPAILISYGFDQLTMGLIFVISGSILAYGVRFLPLIRRRISDYRALVICSLLMTLFFLLFSLDLPYIGFLAAILIAIIGGFGYTIITVVVNENISSQFRATTLSTVAMILKIPLIIIAPFAGIIVEGGELRTFILSFSIVMSLLLILNVVYYKRRLLKGYLFRA